MQFKALSKLALVSLVWCLSSNSGLAQEPDHSKPIMATASSNEDAKAVLDLVAERAGKDELIFLIIRLGNGEQSRRLNRLRLHTASNYLESTRAIPKERIVRAEAERVRGLARLEIYLRGKLLVVFTFPRNQNFAPEG
jgi:hypothetical protein